MARDLSGDGCSVAERVRTRVAQQRFEIGEGRVVRTTRTVGAARHPFFREQLDALSWEQVISVADRARYVAKASGRNAGVGLHGIVAPPIQGLFSAISHGAQQLVREANAAGYQLADRRAQPGVGSLGPGAGGERLVP